MTIKNIKRLALNLYQPFFIANHRLKNIFYIIRQLLSFYAELIIKLRFCNKKNYKKKTCKKLLKYIKLKSVYVEKRAV